MSKDHHKHEKRPQEDSGVPIDIRRAGDEVNARPEDSETPGERTAGPIESVSAEQFARLFAEKEELTRTLVRRQADFDNYRKRMEQERKDASRHGAARLVQELLPVLDGFERGLRSHPADDEYHKGVELIYRHFRDTLAKQGLERIAAEGKRFDPHYHEAIDRVETHDHPDGAIIEVVQEGYLLDGRVLRPSLVRVAVSPEGGEGDKSLEEHFRVF